MPLAFPPFGSVLTSGEASAGDPTIIAASTWRWDGNSGPVRVSSGVPLKPGMVTASTLNKYQVFVGGVEQAVALRALDGTFPDGSYRAIGTQFLYTLTHDTPVAAEIRVNMAVRGTTDIAWVEPTHVTVQTRAVIAPTDPVHLCATFVTLGPLTPAVNDTGLGDAWSDQAVFGWGQSGVADGSNAGGAIYDHQNGLLQFYCRTGARIWYQRWYDWANSLDHDPRSGIWSPTSTPPALEGQYQLLLPYVLPRHTPGYAPPYDYDMNDCTGNGQWNSEPITTGFNSSCGGPSEWFSLRHISSASSYWMSAWRQHKRILARFVNQGMGWIPIGGYPEQRDHWVYDDFGTRFNFGAGGMWATLIGYLTGCTTVVNTPSGLVGPASWNYQTYLPWLIDTLEEKVWNLPGDYRNGTVGQADTQAGVPGNPDSGITNFMISIPGEFLAMYYDCVYPDARIPGMMQTLADYIIGQSRASNAVETGYPDKWPCAYRNARPAAIASPTFTASVVNGSKDMTYVSGEVHPDDFRDRGQPFFKLSGTGSWGPGIGTPGTPLYQDFEIHGNSTKWVTYQTATVSGTVTMLVPMDGWYLAMNVMLLAWVAAYTGNPYYATWRDRAAHVANLTLSNWQTKIWGEFFGGTRQSWLYYAHGGTIRGTPGMHPTVITNPPLQASLG